MTSLETSPTTTMVMTSSTHDVTRPLPLLTSSSASAKLSPSRIKTIAGVSNTCSFRRGPQPPVTSRLATSCQTMMTSSSSTSITTSASLSLTNSATCSLPVLPCSCGAGASARDRCFNDSDEIARLKTALQSERNLTKHLRRQLASDVRQVRDEEQKRAHLLLKDAKSRFHFEKQRDLDALKESLNRKFDADLAKVSKVKDAEIRRISADLQKLRDAPVNVGATSNGFGENSPHTSARAPLSNGAAGASERVRLEKEVRELTQQLRARDKELATSRERERKLASEVTKERDDWSVKLSKLQRDSDLEIRKLVS